MHRDFGEWYRIATLDPTDELLRKRWQGVEAFVPEVSAATAFELVRLFYGLPLRSAEFRNAFEGVFQETDASFRIRDNAVELGVLAGAVMVEVFATQQDIADSVSLAALCVNFRGYGRAGQVPEIVRLASAYMHDRRSGLRRREKAGDSPAAMPEESASLKAAIDGLAQNAAATAAPHLQKVLRSVVKSTNRLAELATEAARRQELLDEEVSMLWWVMGGHSRDLAVPLATLPAAAVPLVIGRELADLTAVSPGPFATPALLHRMLSYHATAASTPTSVSAAVGAMTREWLGNWLDTARGFDGADLCPVLQFGHLGAGSGREYGDRSVPAMDLAIQVYDEALLVRAGTPEE